MNLAEVLKMLKEAHDDCQVEDDIRKKQVVLAGLPSKDTPDVDILKFVQVKLEETAKEFEKSARQIELTTELLMLNDMNKDSSEYEHLLLHLDSTALTVEILRREAQIYQRFCELLQHDFYLRTAN